MPKFVLNAADTVDMHPLSKEPGRLNWIGVSLSLTDLDAFTQGYVEALFFTEEERLCEESGREMPAVEFNMSTMESRFVGGDSPGFADLAPDTLAAIIDDCAAFQTANAVDLAQAYAETNYDAEQAGRDFWFTRNGHGVGYWDRSELDWFAASDNSKKLQDTLSAACRDDGVDVYVGDDGKVYAS